MPETSPAPRNLTALKGAIKARQGHRWHLLYYVLAAFNILTVGLTLRLNHQMQDAFAGSVEV
ncbi:MAG: hypothetical protein RLZZ265_2631, partial [Verrucomicrobiota bacterium]